MLGLAFLPGCEPSLPKATPGGGFIVTTLLFRNGVFQVSPFTTIELDWVSDYDYTAAGDPSTFRGTTNALGLIAATGKRAPAKWRFYWISGGDPACPIALNQGALQTVGLHRNETFTCYITTQQQLDIRENPATISPATFPTQALPAWVTVYGQGFSSQHGMPLVQYYDVNGNLIAQSTASVVAADGSYIQGPTPDLSQATTGTYVGIAQNVNSDGSLSPVGSGSVDVIATPGYVAFVRGTNEYGCGMWYNFVYKDSHGNATSYPNVALTTPGCPVGTQQTTVHDAFGNPITLYLANGTINGTIVLNGAQYSLPLDFSWN
jgi:hypothetical protein